MSIIAPSGHYHCCPLREHDFQLHACPDGGRRTLTKLKHYPAFQALRAKAQTHQCQFRVKETERLKQLGKLDEVLDSRTESAWNALHDCRAKGMNQHEAEEVALPNILLPSEQEEQERLDGEEQMEDQ